MMNVVAKMSLMIPLVIGSSVSFSSGVTMKQEDSKSVMAIVAGVPVLVKEVEGKSINRSDRIIDTRIEFDAKIEVQEVIFGDYDGSHVDVIIRSHNEEMALSSMFVVIVVQEGGESRKYVSPASRLACWPNSVDVPPELIRRIRYEFADAESGSKCVVF